MSARNFAGFWWWLVWAMAGVGVSLLVFLTLGSSIRDAAANHSGNAYLQPGLNQYSPRYCYYWYSYPGKHACWHPSSNGPAIDYNTGAGSTAWKEVIHNTTGANQHWKIQHVYYCKGAEARIYDQYAGNESYYKGSVRYLHVIPHWWNNGIISNFSSISIGYVHNGPEVAGCGWSGAHLHEDANNAAWTPFWPNWYGNHPYTHIDAICWTSGCP